MAQPQKKTSTGTIHATIPGVVASGYGVKIKKQLDEIETLSPARIRERVEDWRHRLEGLMDQIEDWRREVASDYEAHRYATRQVNEELMQKHGVAPVELPVMTLLKGQQRVVFMPSALWLLGSNGRVNVVTPSNQYSLVDLGGVEGQPSDWRIVSRDINKAYVPFDREALRKIIGNENL